MLAVTFYASSSISSAQLALDNAEELTSLLEAPPESILEPELSSCSNGDATACVALMDKASASMDDLAKAGGKLGYLAADVQMAVKGELENRYKYYRDVLLLSADFACGKSVARSCTRLGLDYYYSPRPNLFQALLYFNKGCQLGDEGGCTNLQNLKDNGVTNKVRCFLQEDFFKDAKSFIRVRVEPISFAIKAPAYEYIKAVNSRYSMIEFYFGGYYKESVHYKEFPKRWDEVNKSTRMLRKEIESFDFHPDSVWLEALALEDSSILRLTTSDRGMYKIVLMGEAAEKLAAAFEAGDKLKYALPAQENNQTQRYTSVTLDNFVELTSLIKEIQQNLLKSVSDGLCNPDLHELRYYQPY